jgi:hypothetical protein
MQQPVEARPSPSPPGEVEGISVAHQQQARSFELRAASSLARLWRDQGPARAGLQLVHRGFRTADLKDAKALLEELAREPLLVTHCGNRGQLDVRHGFRLVSGVGAASSRADERHPANPVERTSCMYGDSARMRAAAVTSSPRPTEAALDGDGDGPTVDARGAAASKRSSSEQEEQQRARGAAARRTGRRRRRSPVARAPRDTVTLGAARWGRRS